jgi:predicted nucleic acid-binding protein
MVQFFMPTAEGRAVARRMLEKLEASNTRQVRARQEDERRARAIIRQYSDKDLSLIDAISFAVMEHLHLRGGWAYDQHFAQYGFQLIR